MTVEPDLSLPGHTEVLAVGDMALRVRGRDGSAVASGQEVRNSAAVSSGRSAAMKWLASIDVTAKVGCPGAPDLRHVVVEPRQAAAPGPRDLHPQRRSGAGGRRCRRAGRAVSPPAMATLTAAATARLQSWCPRFEPSNTTEHLRLELRSGERVAVSIAALRRPPWTSHGRLNSRADRARFA
jgi:hypothetical protein